MLGSGYVRLYRSLLSWEWYTDTNTKAVFLHLILTANWEPKKWRGITIERGQRVYSSQKLATELHMSRQAVRTAISHLLETGELTNYSTPKYSIITVKNYDSYQQLTNCQPTINQLSTNESTNKSTNYQPSLNPQCSAKNQDLEKRNQPTNQPSIEAEQLQNQPQLNKERNNKGSNKENKEKTPDKPATESLYKQVRESFIINCVSLPKPNAVEKWTAARKKAIRDKNITINEFTQTFKRIEQSDFLTGKTGKWHGCSLDWILKPSNWQKINEGNYDNRKNPKGTPNNLTFDIDEYERDSIYDNENKD